MARSSKTMRRRRAPRASAPARRPAACLAAGAPAAAAQRVDRAGRAERGPHRALVAAQPLLYSSRGRCLRRPSCPRVLLLAVQHQLAGGAADSGSAKLRDQRHQRVRARTAAARRRSTRISPLDARRRRSARAACRRPDRDEPYRRSERRQRRPRVVGRAVGDDDDLAAPGYSCARRLAMRAGRRAASLRAAMTIEIDGQSGARATDAARPAVRDAGPGCQQARDSPHRRTPTISAEIQNRRSSS